MNMQVNLVNPVTLTLVLTFCASLVQGEGITSCVYDATSCGCQSDKGLISLKKYGEKGFQYYDEETSADFHWNPCKDVELITTTASCIKTFPPVYSFDCGMYNTATSTVKDGAATFHMMSENGDAQSEFKCTCADGEDFKYVQESPSNYYYFELAAVACCPGGGSAHGASSEGLSGGSYLLIVFFSLLFVYIVVGVSVQVGLRNAEGKNRVPHVTFWMAIPGLIKDGFLFTLSCGKRPGYGEV